MLDSSTIIITRSDISKVVIMKLYVFSKKLGNEYANADIPTKILPVISNASSTTSFVSIDLKYGYTPMLINITKINHRKWIILKLLLSNGFDNDMYMIKPRQTINDIKI